MVSQSVAAASSAPVVLQNLLAQHGVTAAGVDLIRSVRAGQPVRSVAGRAGNVTGRYPSLKMGCTIQYESRTVEFPFVILCETDPAVAQYFDQPCVLVLDYKSKRSRRVVVDHTPDFLVLGAEFAGFVECKPAEKLVKLATDTPNRYVADGEGQWRCPPGEAAAAPYGLGYRVWTPVGVTPAFIDNVRFLEARWRGDPRVFDTDDVQRVVEGVRTKPGLSLEELVHDFADPDLVHWTIFYRHVHVDLAAHFLSQPDLVRVFVDASAAAAWAAAIASVIDEPPSPSDVLARSVLASYPPEALAVALERFQVLRPAIEKELPTRTFTGPGAHSQRRWLAAYRKARRDGGVGLVGLCPKSHLRGNPNPRFPSGTYAVLEEVIADVYENCRNVTAKVAYAVALDRCDQRGLPCLSYDSFLKYLKKRDPDQIVGRRQGLKAAAAAAPAFGPRDLSVQGQGPMDVTHIDHTLLDVLVRVGPGSDALTDRLWLTVVICAWSRCVVGYDLSFDAPAVAGLFTAVRDTFDRQGCIPNRIVVDRGPEFGSLAFDQLCAACRIDKLQRPPGRPKFGAVVERLFGTVNKQLVHTLSGNTQLLKEPRRMSRDVDPVQDAVWRLSDLDIAVQRFLFDVYPRQPHDGLDGMTPHARFQLGRETIGLGRPLPASPDLRFLLWPPSRRGTAAVDSRTGIVVDNIRYWHPDMRASDLSRKQVPVRVDPHDAAHVVVFLRGRWVLCVAERAADFAGRSRRELRIASHEVRRRRRGDSKREAIRARHLGAMLRELAQTEEGALQAQRDAERREVLHRRGLRLVTGSVTPGEPHPADAAAGAPPLDLDEIGSGEPL